MIELTRKYALNISKENSGNNGLSTGTANFVYKFKKSENFEKCRYNANGNANI